MATFQSLPQATTPLSGNEVIALNQVQGGTLVTAQAPVSALEGPALAQLAASNGSSLVGFLQSGTGAVARTVQAKERDVVNIADFGPHADGVTDDLFAFNAAIAYLASINGGVLECGPYSYALSATLLIDSGNILIRGAGANMSHNGGTGMPNATTLIWIGASGGTVVQFATPNSTSSSMRTDGGIVDVTLEGSAVAGVGLNVTSWCAGTFRVFVHNVTQTAVHISCYAGGALADPSDSQRNVFDRCQWRMIDVAAVQSAVGFVLTSASPGTNGANTSFNYFRDCTGLTYNGNGWELFDADNNTFVGCGNYIPSGGTGLGLLIGGADSNYFWGFSMGGAGGIAIRGTASGYFANPSANCFFCADGSNDTVYPTLDPSCYVQWHSSTDGYANLVCQKMVVSDQIESTAYQLALLPTNATAFFINHAAGGAISLGDGTDTVGFGFDGSNNLRTVPSVAGLTFDLTQGAGMAFKAPTATLTSPAPTVASGQVALGTGTATTVGSAGSASALPSAPVGYLVINIGGTNYKIPYYNA